MAKWADYCITEVDLYTNGVINKVKVYKDTGEKLSEPKIVEKQVVVDSINDGNSYCTATKNSEGKFNKGSDVEVVKTDGDSYIRTVGNLYIKDNLGELPKIK